MIYHSQIPLKEDVSDFLWKKAKRSKKSETTYEEGIKIDITQCVNKWFQSVKRLYSKYNRAVQGDSYVMDPI